MPKSEKNLKYLIDRTFNDQVIAVEPPREWWIEYPGVGRVHEGYIVTVRYRYKGSRNYYFVLCGRNRLIPESWTHRNAQKFYETTLGNIRSRNENTK